MWSPAKASETPGGGVFYILTSSGEELVPILDAIGRWGAKTIGRARTTGCRPRGRLLRQRFEQDIGPVPLLHKSPIKYRRGLLLLGLWPDRRR